MGVFTNTTGTGVYQINTSPTRTSTTYEHRDTQYRQLSQAIMMHAQDIAERAGVYFAVPVRMELLEEPTQYRHIFRVTTLGGRRITADIMIDSNVIEDTPRLELVKDLGEQVAANLMLNPSPWAEKNGDT